MVASHSLGELRAGDYDGQFSPDIEAALAGFAAD
jgi:hypothetical protein